MATQSQPRRSRGAAQADKDALDKIAEILNSPMSAPSIQEIDAYFRKVCQRILEAVQATGRL